MEQYHVLETHPQLRIPGRYPPRDTTFDARSFIDAELRYLHTMSDGMAGMVHANDVRIAEGMRDIELPDDPSLGVSTWHLVAARLLDEGALVRVTVAVDGGVNVNSPADLLAAAEYARRDTPVAYG